MKTQNRPYSLVNIFDNLHGAIKKSQLGKILDALVEEGSLIMKEYNSKIYLFNQDKLDIKVTDADIEQIQKEKPIQLCTKDEVFSFDVNNGIILSFEKLFSFYSLKTLVTVYYTNR